MTNCLHLTQKQNSNKNGPKKSAKGYSLDSKESYAFQDRPLTFYSYFKLACSFIVIPLRLLLFLPIILLSNFLVFVANPFQFNKIAANTPTNAWERLIMKGIQVLLRISLFIFGVYRINVKSRPSASCKLIVSNHVSMIDIPLLMYLTGCSFVSKSSVQNIPFLSTDAKFFRTIFLDRHSPTSREKTKSEISRRALSSDEDLIPPLVIFAESTTTNGKCIIPFKLGAFYDAMPVQPVVIKYHYKHFSPAYTGTESKNGEVVKTNKFFYLWRLMAQFSHSVEVRFLPVYEPSKIEKASPAIYAKNVQEYMAKELDLPIKMVDEYNY